MQLIAINTKPLGSVVGFDADLTLWLKYVITMSHDALQPKKTFSHEFSLKEVAVKRSMRLSQHLENGSFRYQNFIHLVQ